MTDKIKCPGDHLDSCIGCSKFRITRNGNIPSGNTCLYFLNKEKDRETGLSRKRIYIKVIFF